MRVRKKKPIPQAPPDPKIEVSFDSMGVHIVNPLRFGAVVPYDQIDRVITELREAQLKLHIHQWKCKP